MKRDSPYRDDDDHKGTRSSKRRRRTSKDGTYHEYKKEYQYPLSLCTWNMKEVEALTYIRLLEEYIMTEMKIQLVKQFMENQNRFKISSKEKERQEPEEHKTAQEDNNNNNKMQTRLRSKVERNGRLVDIYDLTVNTENALVYGQDKYRGIQVEDVYCMVYFIENNCPHQGGKTQQIRFMMDNGVFKTQTRYICNECNKVVPKRAVNENKIKETMYMG